MGTRCDLLLFVVCGCGCGCGCKFAVPINLSRAARSTAPASCRGPCLPPVWSLSPRFPASLGKKGGGTFVDAGRLVWGGGGKARLHTKASWHCTMLLVRMLSRAIKGTWMMVGVVHAAVLSGGQCRHWGFQRRGLVR